MNLRDYFENTPGRGVLATSDRKGIVDVAVYARPHFVDQETCVFLMADRRTHKNLQDNPHAAYLFMEQSERYVGKRLYLTKTKESEDQDTINQLRRKKRPSSADNQREGTRSFLVYFHVDSIRPLVGDHDKTNQCSENLCPTCQKEITGSGHLCVPVKQADETCDWCGALMVERRHLCNDKIKDLAYYCNSCGRTAVQAEHLCHPKEIEPGK